MQPFKKTVIKLRCSIVKCIYCTYSAKNQFCSRSFRFSTGNKTQGNCKKSNKNKSSKKIHKRIISCLKKIFKFFRKRKRKKFSEKCKISEERLKSFLQKMFFPTLQITFFCDIVKTCFQGKEGSSK